MLRLDFAKESVDEAHARLIVHCTIRARPQSAHGLYGMVFPLEAHCSEFLLHLGRFLGEAVDKRQIAFIIAGAPGLECVQFDGIEDPGFLLGVVVGKLTAQLLKKLLVEGIAGLLVKNALNHGAAPGRHGVLGFKHGVGRVVAAARDARIAAGIVGLFENNDPLAGFGCFERCRKTRAARTDYDDVGRFFHMAGLKRLLGSRLRERGDVKPSLLHAVADSCANGKRSERCARDDVYIRRLVLHDVGWYFRPGKVGDRMRFRPIHHFDVLDPAVLDRRLYDDLAVSAERLSRINAVFGR